MNFSIHNDENNFDKLKIHFCEDSNIYIVMQHAKNCIECLAVLDRYFT